MGTPDQDAQAALAREVIHPVTIAWLDILGDPIRVTTAPYNLSFSGTGDLDLDGQTFSAIDATLIGVGQVQHKEGGANTLTITLSGLIGVDSDLLDQIGNKTNWQGRTARIWKMMLNPDLSRAGQCWDYYTGYLTVPKIVGDQTSQTISLSIESYLAFLSQASNRSYLSQREYDPEDHSADAAIAIANGMTGAGLVGGGSGAAANAATGFASGGTRNAPF